jgi:hypothetical protein
MVSKVWVGVAWVKYDAREIGLIECLGTKEMFAVQRNFGEFCKCMGIRLMTLMTLNHHSR